MQGLLISFVALILCILTLFQKKVKQKRVSEHQINIFWRLRSITHIHTLYVNVFTLYFNV